MDCVAVGSVVTPVQLSRVLSEDRWVVKGTE